MLYYWVQIEYHTDGFNLDFEEAVDANSPESLGLTLLMQAFVDAFHTKIPGSQVTIDVAWSPNCIDGRCYDYAALAKASDFMFVMVMYDATVCVEL
jgi:di-N-acetylchitobiase